MAKKEGPFTVHVEAGIGPRREWVIQARIEWRDGPPLEGSRLRGEGRLALLLAVAHAGLEGRKFGHDRAHVWLDEGDGVEREIRIGDPGTALICMN